MSDTKNDDVRSTEVAQQATTPTSTPANGVEPAPTQAGAGVEQLRAGLQQLIDSAADESARHPVRAFAQALANLKQAPVVTFWREASIERSDAEDVYALLDSLPEQVDHIWLILSSSGGSLDAAYQVGRLLQARAKKVTAVIPRWAKSAATLVTLGCDEVVMHPLAELGPLDAQVETQRNGQTLMISTLDAVRANDYLRTYAVDTFDKLMHLINQRAPLTTYEAGVSMAAHVLEPLVKPMFAKVDPVQLGEHDRALSLATEYGRRLMRRSYSAVPEEERNRMLTKLVKGYAAHSFVIDLQEASGLGLNVRPPTPEERELLNDCTTYFSECELHHHDDIDLNLPKKKDDPIPLGPGAAQA
jgi:hypothetical protein